jgi:hypothetical protein
LAPIITSWGHGIQPFDFCCSMPDDEYKI